MVKRSETYRAVIASQRERIEALKAKVADYEARIEALCELLYERDSRLRSIALSVPQDLQPQYKGMAPEWAKYRVRE